MIYTKISREAKINQHKCQMCFSVYLAKQEEVCLNCKSYDHKIKDVCFICDKKIKLNRARYIQSGNICGTCSMEIDRNIKKNIWQKKGKKEVKQSFPKYFKTREKYLKWYSDYRKANREKINKRTREYMARHRLEDKLKNKGL